MNIQSIHCSAVILSDQQKNSASTNTSLIGSISLSAGDAPVSINPAFPVVILLLVPELIQSILTCRLFPVLCCMGLKCAKLLHLCKHATLFLLLKREQLCFKLFLKDRDV